MSQNELTPIKGATQLSLDPSLGAIDISHLPQETQNRLQEYAAMKKIDLQAAGHQARQDLETTAHAVANMATVTRRMSASGDAVTIRQTIENSSGRTEILMGNTDEAKRGRVNQADYTVLYVIAGIVILIVVASFLRP